MGVSCGLDSGDGAIPGGPFTGEGRGEVLEVTIGPELVDCVGVGPRKYLIVDGEFFYGWIEGFEHEPGYRYRVRMERYDAFPGMAEPPQDASRYGYRLVEIVEKVQEQ